MIGVVAGGYAEAGATGLYPLRYDLDRDALVAGDPQAAIVNVSAGVRLPVNGRWMFVDEIGAQLGVAEMRDGRWAEVARTTSGGQAPCHLAVDAAGRRLAVAHYGSGDVAIHALDPTTGLPVGQAAVRRSTGSGPDAERQAGPHVHWVGFEPCSGRLYATDLGADRVLAFDLDPDAELGPGRTAYAAPPGSGPRQIAWHPSLPLAFLVSELASTLTVLRICDDGALSVIDLVSTLPQDAAPGSLGGALVLNALGDRLYVSNRGHDSVAAFMVETAGAVTPLGHVASGGTSPRFLLLLEEVGRLMVAHEQAGGVTALALEPDGRLRPTAARADVPGAAFLARAGDLVS